MSIIDGKNTPMTTSSGAEKAPMTAPPAPEEGRSRKTSWLGVLRFDKFSGLYLAVILIIIFSLWMPTTFGTPANARVIAASAAITGIITLAVVVSLAAGVFDLSLAANMSFSICLLGALIAYLHVPWVLAILITLVAGGAVGAVNALVITKLGVDAVIATLGMSSILAALSFWVADGQTILLTGTNPGFTALGSASLMSIPITVFYLLIVTLLLWFLLEHTPFGRYLYAIGSNAQATRLAGIKVVRLQWATLILTGFLASLAGVVLTLQLGAASFGAGLPYLLPAFAAAFLGSTQVLPGRFNVLGTIVALYLLAIAVKGLQLQYPDLPWIKDLVEGLVVIVAVAITTRTIKRPKLA
ncbi:ABC transporter permease [Microbacterium trichothecenolyticum]|uniref:D-allose transport system permease protein AlsC n=1 Tax=Microbacterium trichothecenolyticum TaxID=69370 RepID=A0A0M2HDK2_MICTR|nr:ABC transporter permease [Microbacterium trichothecenolyticum]KJL42311.1 D-allose transport system permease protein AlsC [Microbacterium trichothecenolyticum]